MSATTAGEILFPDVLKAAIDLVKAKMGSKGHPELADGTDKSSWTQHKEYLYPRSWTNKEIELHHALVSAGLL